MGVKVLTFYHSVEEDSSSSQGLADSPLYRDCNRDCNKEGRHEYIVRGAFIKAAAASVVALVLGLVKAQPAKAALTGTLTDRSIVVDFTNQTLDRFSLKGKFDALTKTTNTADIWITLKVENKATGDIVVWEGPPDVVR